MIINKDLSSNYAYTEELNSKCVKLIEEGKKALKPDKFELWEQTVKNSFNQIYKGDEIILATKVIVELNSGSINKAIEIIFDYDHSVNTFSIVFLTVENFSSKRKFKAFSNRIFKENK